MGQKGRRFFSLIWLDFSLIPEAIAAEVTVEDRIKDCAEIPKSSVKSSTGVTWNLVSRKHDPKSGKFMEVWKDSKSFGLPTKQEFEQAEKNGVREVVPNIRERWFWSASVHPD